MKMRFLNIKGYVLRSICISCLMGGVLLALASGSAQAQDEQAPAQWLNVTIVHVKAGRQADFEDRVKEITAASNKAGRPPIEVYQVVRGDEGVYHIVSPQMTLAEFDNPPPEIMKPGQMAATIGRLLPTLDSGREFVARNYTQLQLTGEGDADAKLVLLRNIHVAAQRGDDFVKWVRDDLQPNLKKAKMSFTFARGSFGDSPQNFYAVEPIPNWAALDGPSPMEEMLGEKGMTQLLDKLKGIVLYSNMVLLRPRPDLANPGADE